MFWEPRADGAALAQVKRWFAEALDAQPEGSARERTLLVSELACHEPGCPPRETVLAALYADGARARWHFHGAASELTRDAVFALVSPAASPRDDHAHDHAHDHEDR